MTDGGVRYLVNGEISPAALAALLDRTSWARGRTQEGLAAMLRGSLAHVVAWSGEEPVGFARAIGDGVYRALIEDVVVREDRRGRAVGREMVVRLLGELASVEEVRLVTGEERLGFYGRLGFRRDEQPHMRRP